MKWIQKFENFNKDTKYNNDDIINCIKNNCNIYSNDVPGHPGINDKVALTPVCIDNDGIITIDIDSKGISDIEIPISSISRIDIKNSINEGFEMSDYLHHFTKDLTKKGLVVAILLEMIDYADIPVKDVNYLTISLKTNMLKYLTNNKLDQFRMPTDNRLQNNLLHVYDNRLQTEARIGRVITKILNTVDKSNFEFKSNIELEIISGSQYDRGKDYVDNIVKRYDKLIINDPDFNLTYANMTNNSKISINLKISQSNKELYSNHFLFAENNIFSKSLAISKDEMDKIRSIYNDGLFYVECYYLLNNKKVSEINDTDIQLFVNELSALVKESSPDSLSIEEVNGDEIVKWYNRDNYKIPLGKLGGSCMATQDCQDFFDIYTKNKNVSLLILKDNEKLFGRALLWKLDDGEYFMDRVYTILEPDEIIFTNYAIKNGYYHRSNGTNESFKYYLGNEIVENKILTVNLDYSDFIYYPYLDTLKYLDIDGKILSNNPKISYDHVLISTEGRWEGYHDD
jgi:hypothetical protein